jgi:hypothetical protein
VRSDGRPVVISHEAQKRGAVANRMRAVERAVDLAPTIAQIRGQGALTLAAIAVGLNDAGIPMPRGQGKWSPAQVKRTLEALKEAESAEKTRRPKPAGSLMVSYRPSRRW